MAWPPKRSRMPGAFGDQIEGVAQVRAANRAAGTPDQAPSLRAKANTGRCSLSPEARGQDAHHAFVPARVEKNDAGRFAGVGQGFQQNEGLFLHAGLDSRRSRLRASSCWAMASARLASSVVRHSMPRRMSARRPAALRRGPRRKPRSKADAREASRPAALEQGGQPGLEPAPAHALQALADENAVVAVEFDHVGDGAQGDEVEEVGQVGFGASGEPTRWRSSACRASMT